MSDYADRCPTCGFSRQQRDRRLLRSQGRIERQSDEIDATYAGIRTLVEHAPDERMKAALVGLLPEVRDIEPEDKARMRERGLEHLVQAQEERIAANWAELMGPDA